MLDFKGVLEAILRTQATLVVSMIAVLIGLEAIWLYLDHKVKRTRLQGAQSASRAAHSSNVARPSAVDHGRPNVQVKKNESGLKS